MNKCSVFAILALMLLAVSTVKAQETPAPRIAYADLPTPAEIMPAYADWSRAEFVILDVRKLMQKLDPFFRSMGEPVGVFGLGLVFVVFILAALGIPRGIASLSNDGETISFGGKPYSVNHSTGQVLEVRKDITQEISGGGGGGTIVDGRGTINIEPIKTETTITDTLYMADEDGIEHAVKLYNVDVDVRKGNLVTVQWLTARGSNSGPIAQVYNHSTRVQFLSVADIKALLRPSWFMYLLTIGGWVAAWQLLSLLPSEGGFDFGGTIIFILVAATWIEFFGRAVASLRFGRFKKSPAFQNLVKEIVQEGQAPGSIGVAQ